MIGDTNSICLCVRVLGGQLYAFGRARAYLWVCVSVCFRDSRSLLLSVSGTHAHLPHKGALLLWRDPNKGQLHTRKHTQNNNDRCILHCIVTFAHRTEIERNFPLFWLFRQRSAHVKLQTKTNNGAFTTMAIKHLVDDRDQHRILFIGDILAQLEANEPNVNSLERAQELCEELVSCLCKLHALNDVTSDKFNST